MDYKRVMRSKGRALPWRSGSYSEKIAVIFDRAKRSYHAYRIPASCLRIGSALRDQARTYTDGL